MFSISQLLTCVYYLHHSFGLTVVTKCSPVSIPLVSACFYFFIFCWQFFVISAYIKYLDFDFWTFTVRTLSCVWVLYFTTTEWGTPVLSIPCCGEPSFENIYIFILVHSYSWSILVWCWMYSCKWKLEERCRQIKLFMIDRLQINEIQMERAWARVFLCSMSVMNKM